MIKIETTPTVGLFNFVSFGGYFGSQTGYKYNLLYVRYKYFNLGVLSSLEMNNNMSNYYLPFGFYYPLKVGNLKLENIPYTIGLNTNFFLISDPPVGEHYKTPKILEISLNYDTILLSLSTGYRFQIGKWTEGLWDEKKSISYAQEIGTLEGFFIDVSVGLTGSFFRKNYRTRKQILPNPSLSVTANFNDNVNMIMIGENKLLDIQIDNYGLGLAENLVLNISISNNNELLFDTLKYVGNLEMKSSKNISFPILVNDRIESESECKLRVRCDEKDGFSSTSIKDVTIIPDSNITDFSKTGDEYIYVSVNVANIREGPGTNYNISFQSFYGDILKIIDYSKLWIYIQEQKSDRRGWIYSKLTSEDKPIRSANEYVDSNESLYEGFGNFMHYNFNFKKIDDKYIVRINPFLPRNDGIVIGAMLEVINKIYGKHRIVNLTPSLVNRNGINYISFEGINYNYLFLLIKQDTGEVHSFSLSREIK